MKNIVSYFCIAIVTFILSGCNIQTKPTEPTTSDLLSEFDTSENGIEDFLLNAIQGENIFTSSKLSDFEGNNFEQTYYHLQIQDMLGIKSNIDTKAVFDKIFDENVSHDIYYLKYFRSDNSMKKYEKNIEKFLTENPQISYDNIEKYFIITRYFEDISSLNTLAVRDFLETSIPLETDYTNILTLSYWYTELKEHGIIRSTSDFWSAYVDFFKNDFQFVFLDTDFYKYEKLYYYLSICNICKITPNINGNILSDIPNELPYTFLGSELYYALKCLELQNIEFNGQEFFSQYYTFVVPEEDGLYSSFVIEQNNQIEKYRTFLLLKYHFQSNNSKVQLLEKSLKQDVSTNLFQSGSATQSYYEALFCNLEGINIPVSSLNIIRNEINTELEKGNTANNTKLYYLFLILDLCQEGINTTDGEFILSQYNLLKSQKDTNLAICLLDLISIYELMDDSDIQNELLLLSETGRITTEDSYQHYIVLSKKTNTTSIFDMPISSINLNDKVLIQNNSEVMSISIIYYYCITNNSINDWR